jgi:hypothetical protein
VVRAGAEFFLPRNTRKTRNEIEPKSFTEGREGRKEMSVYFQEDIDVCLLLPSVAVAAPECECCGERNFAVLIGWFTWMLVIDFGCDDESEG